MNFSRFKSDFRVSVIAVVTSRTCDLADLPVVIPVPLEAYVGVSLTGIIGSRIALDACGLR